MGVCAAPGLSHRLSTVDIDPYIFERVTFAYGSAAEVPALARTVPPALFGFTTQTTLGNGMVISDVPGPTGGIMLKSATGASIIVNDTGIYIQNGRGASIVMTGPTVTVNQGALVVT